MVVGHCSVELSFCINKVTKWKLCIIFGLSQENPHYICNQCENNSCGERWSGLRLEMCFCDFRRDVDSFLKLIVAWVKSPSARRQIVCVFCGALKAWSPAANQGSENASAVMSASWWHHNAQIKPPIRSFHLSLDKAGHRPARVASDWVGSGYWPRASWGRSRFIGGEYHSAYKWATFSLATVHAF